MFSLYVPIIEAYLESVKCNILIYFIDMLYLTYALLIGIINNTRETDIELT